MPTPRKADSEHWLTGTKSQAKILPDSQVVASRPRLPKDLNPAAVAVFKRLCALLKKRRVLTAGDSELLRLYAVNYDRHVRALAKIQEQGEICVYNRLNNHGEQVECEKQNLWLKPAETAEKNMVAILDRLGLTPHNRDKVKPAAPEPQRKAPEKTPAELEQERFDALIGGER